MHDRTLRVSVYDPQQISFDEREMKTVGQETELK